MPLRNLSFGVKIVFENPRSITCYAMFEKKISFSMRSRRPRHKFLRFFFCSLVRILGTSLAQIFCMSSSKVKNSWTIWRFKFNTLLIILSHVDQTSQDPLYWSHFRPFLTCKVFHNEVRLLHSHGHPKMLHAT